MRTSDLDPLAFGIVILIFARCFISCSSPPAQPSQSWDQENLKRNDHGCPTAIFVAPGGELKQCEI